MITVYWGNPGCGKTTLAVKKLVHNQKHYMYCYGNFPHTVCGAYSFRVSDKNVLGSKSPRYNSYVALDEAGIDFNNRAYKALPKETIKWFKLHRHYGVDIDVFSQSWEDMDVTIRRLAVQYWYMYRIGPWTLCRRVYKRTMVDKTTHQIIDGYRMASILWLLVWPLQYVKIFGVNLIDFKWTLTFRPKYYKYFDTFSREVLPEIESDYNKFFGVGQDTFYDKVKEKVFPLYLNIKNKIFK